MRHVTKPRKPEENKYIFTEGINYFETGRASIWGEGDKDTLNLLKKTRINGAWLNLAAGDGRYNSILLENADFVVASDVDKSALSKLWHNTPEKYRQKLRVEAFNTTEKFPFKSCVFDGIFCTGTLHLFHEIVLGKIFSEMDRVLKPRGRVIIDFATDIKRISPDGKTVVFGDEPLYTLKDGKKALKNLFRNYKIKMYESEVPEDEYKQANPPYKFSCKFILLIASKN